MKKYLIALFILQSYCSNSYAGTMGQITLPTKATPYCEFMPFDFVDNDKKFSTLQNRIWVKKPVTFTVTSPKYFDSHWLRWLKLGNNPLTGLTIIYKNTVIKPIKISEQQYQYTLPMLPAGDVYAFVGELKYPSHGLQICVK